ncbi:hypothetical protein ASPZODRAFT_20804 [Penicilliopsis zonata CBS 506.65]|uniref:Uncharacterized protein n=1 Tax=Penicilliopsis zonata CBS 506.65 TaxID=1073090 RepID=A0A1L9S4I8_9EURO|nr:hypothetical protein ASPZODRAFT_20804 [Penicilliopsis zonata CBS 506.65]OJJ42078.1 hypothetical protein ASPZODRAFT_20804 [Penicilliopsis zonata CBS 506.65]
MPLAVVIPLQVDAFQLNESLINTGKAFIAPFSLPDYSSLEPGARLQHDAIPHLDLRAAVPSSINARLSDLDTGVARQDRLGVYLHWTIPKPFRAGVMATESAEAAHETNKKKRGIKGDSEFTALPDRWVIIRRINDTTPLPKYAGFMLESNRIRRLNRDELAGVDLDTEAAPFVDHTGTPDTQHGVLLGAKNKLDEWREELTDDADETTLADFHVPLTITDSANLLFADFQHHGMNVFGVHDDLTYFSAETNTLCTLESAEVSYQVIGYHALRGYDPIASSEAATNADLLSTHGMALEEDNAEWLATRAPIRSLCHGTVDLRWSRQNRPAIVPADDAAEAFAQSHPVAIGTDLVDAMAAIFEAPAKTDHADATLAAAFRHLQVLAADPEDDSKTQQGKTSGFKPVHGGDVWKLRNDTEAGEAGEAAQPAQAEAALDKLNASQRLLDAGQRHSRLLQHLLFCEWWKARAAGFADRWDGNGSTAEDDGFESMQSWYQEHLPETRSRTREILTELLTLHLREKDGSVGLLAALQDDIRSLQGDSPVEKIASKCFFSAKDPTILLSEMESSWPEEFAADTIPVRLNTQVRRLDDPAGHDDAWQLFQTGLASLPSWVHACVDDLRHGWSMPGASDYAGQAWFPLFIEWEADYFPIPYQHWTLHETASGTVEYRIKETVDVAGLGAQPRGLSGRSNVLPEGAKAMATLVEQVVNRSRPEMLEKMLPKGQRDAIDKALAALLRNVLGAELHGITDHLLTLVRGTHALPNPTPDNDTPSRWLATLFPRLAVHDHSAVLQFLAAGAGADATPYTALLPVQGVSRRGGEPLFHPVTHGQVRFTKLNLIDKFGQVVCAFDPRPGQLLRPIYPSVSADLACLRNETVPGRAFANAVLAEPEGRCQFFQLGPRINQDARFNAAWVARTTDRQGTSPSSPWRQLLEWESPVWGWVVCNLQDESLQVLTGEGAFCGEILVSSRRWMDSDGQVVAGIPETSSRDLTAFMARLAVSSAFLRRVWDMVVDANEHIHHTPGQADSQPALIGRPLALVSMGWSLELATRPMRDQTDQPGMPDKSLLDYEFALKLGDRQSLHDGLVAYAPASGDSFTFDRLFTVYGDPQPPGQTPAPDSLLQAENIPFHPYWINPTEYSSKAADAFAAAHTDRLQVYAALIDPFQSVHGFSGILPTTTLTVPPWALDRDIKAMKTLLRAGPLLIAGDIPATTASDSDTPSNATLPIDSPPGTWTWMQPVADGNTKNRLYSLTPAPKEFAVSDGLQTLVEGFMRGD